MSEDDTTLYRLVREPLAYADLDTLINNIDLLRNHPRYSVTIGSIISDLWISKFLKDTKGQGKGNFLADRCNATDALLGFSEARHAWRKDREANPSASGVNRRGGSPRFRATTRNDKTTRKKSDNLRNILSKSVDSLPITLTPRKDEAVKVIRALIMWSDRKQLPCRATDCPRFRNALTGAIPTINDAAIGGCQPECKAAALIANALSNLLEEEAVNSNPRCPTDKIWTAPSLGVDARTLIKHSINCSRHIIIPVEPQVVASWPAADFLNTFNRLSEYLAHCKQSGARLIYILEPPPKDTEARKLWYYGEALYRVAMEWLSYNDTTALVDSITWLVRKDDRRDAVADVLFPSDKKAALPCWDSQLRTRYDGKVSEHAMSAWTYCALAPKNINGVENLEFAVTPVSGSGNKLSGSGIKQRKRNETDDHSKRYREPALPVRHPCNSVLPSTVLKCLKAVLQPTTDNLIDGWHGVTVGEFLGLPSTRSRAHKI